MPLLKSRCRAKNPATCAYHGNPLQAETQVEAIATAADVYTSTQGQIIDYTSHPTQWTPGTMKRVAHLITAYDSPAFTRAIIKARYDISEEDAGIGDIESRAGSMYRHRMREAEKSIWNAKRGILFGPQRTEADVISVMRSLQFQAEYDADQSRRHAADAQRNPQISQWERESRAKDEMARSLAARAQAFRLEQLCANMGDRRGTTPATAIDFMGPSFTW